MKQSKLRAGLSEGVIASFYTLNGWFCRVWPVLSIDKVKFSFKKKGETDSFDVYVGTDEFDHLCDQILSGKLLSLIEKETGDFPESWKYATGKKGSKHVNIGKGSSSPIVIQGQTPDYNAFVAVGSYISLCCMAKWWKRISKPYYDGLVSIFTDAMNNNASYYKDYEDDDDDGGENLVPTIAQAPVKEAIYSLRPAGEFVKAANYTDDNPSFTLKCTIKETGESIEVIFLNGYIKKCVDKFNRLVDVIANKKCTLFTVKAVQQEYRGKPQLRFIAFTS